jgi:phage baseplate assembly protein W
MKFAGCPYPIVKHPLGLLHTQEGVDQVKSDLLVLLLTNPGERVMLPTFGTPLRDLVFEPNDATLEDRARDMIASSIRQWEPRITVSQIQVSSKFDESELTDGDDKTEIEHILTIRIAFFDPENIRDVQQLELELPLAKGS